MIGQHKPILISDWLFVAISSKEKILGKSSISFLLQIKLLSVLDCCGRLEYMIQAAACGWDSEVEHSDQNDKRGDISHEPSRLNWLAHLGLRYSVILFKYDTVQINLWKQRIRDVKKLK